MRLFTLLLLWTCPLLQLRAQQTYWIFLQDKDTSHYEPAQQLSPQAIYKRQLQHIALRQYTDIPIRASYLQALLPYGQVRVKSRWLNAVSATLSSAEIEQIRNLPFVKAIQPLGNKLYPAQVPHTANPEDYSPALQQMQAQAFTKAGLTGAGITVGIIDAGFYKADKQPVLAPVFAQNRVLGIKDWLTPNRTDHYDNPETSLDGHGTSVWRMIAGYDTAQHLQYGFAPNAKFYLARTDHGKREFRGEEDLWVAAMEWMDSLGVRLINTSLGYATGFDKDEENYKPEQIDGQTSVIARAAQMAVDEKGILLIVSAGNDGGNKKWGVIATPADAEGVISVGAVSAKKGAWLKAGYSGVGPEALPYLKPNVACYSETGTSFSAPVITGFAACLMQQNPKLSNKELKAIIEKSGHLYPLGNNFLGYGVPQAPTALRLLANKEAGSKKPEEIHTKKDVLSIKVRDKTVTHVAVFHKKNASIVSLQDTLSTTNKQVIIHKPANCTRTTICWPGKLVEIYWE